MNAGLSEKDPIFLIMDASPIVMLSAIERLDWLMEPCGTIWMSDMVMEEVTRDPETDAAPRIRWLAYTRSWIDTNKFRIRRVETKTFETYALALEAWSEADPLNDRERQVLRLAGEGQSAGDIADSLHLSQGTVRNYLSEAIGKLGVGNRIEAYRLARQKGWL